MTTQYIEEILAEFRKLLDEKSDWPPPQGRKHLEGAIHRLLSGKGLNKWQMTFHEFNGLLLLCDENAVSQSFFEFFFGGKQNTSQFRNEVGIELPPVAPWFASNTPSPNDPVAIANLEQLKAGILTFRKWAMYLYGNLRWPYRTWRTSADVPGDILKQALDRGYLVTTKADFDRCKRVDFTIGPNAGDTILQINPEYSCLLGYATKLPTHHKALHSLHAALRDVCEAMACTQADPEQILNGFLRRLAQTLPLVDLFADFPFLISALLRIVREQRDPGQALGSSPSGAEACRLITQLNDDIGSYLAPLEELARRIRPVDDGTRPMAIGDIKKFTASQPYEELKLTAMDNCRRYEVLDHLDLYIATSMRSLNDFQEVRRFVQNVVNRLPGDLRSSLRYFDPTICDPGNRVDKGLLEALMLKRARCVVYYAGISDTFGKDSEAASALAQGKPVIVFVPKATAGTLVGMEKDGIYQKRAELFGVFHPLGLQVDLDTGVAHGVIVVRTEQGCAKAVEDIFNNRILAESEIEEDPGIGSGDKRWAGAALVYRPDPENPKSWIRVVTKDDVLSRAFWNFYFREPH